MNIGSIGSTNFYMPQMSGIRNRAMSAPMSGPMAQGAAAGQGPDPGQMFAKVDSDGSGGLDQTEFQVLAEKISEVTGDTVDVEELFATYDADQDGVLNQEETQTAMEANRPEGPPPPAGGRPEGSEGSAPAMSAGIENYMKMAVLGFAQDQATNTSAMFGGNPGAGGTAAFYGVNTRA